MSIPDIFGPWVNLATSFASNQSQQDAANQSAGIAAWSALEAKKQYEQQREDFMPFYNVGVQAVPEYQKMLSGGYDMQESPAAQYQLEQSTKALNRSLASRGLSGSGNAVNRLTELNRSIAASDWNNQYSRILDALKLGTGASSSMGAASGNLNASNMNAANQLAGIYQNAGNAQASLYSGLGGMANNMAPSGVSSGQIQNWVNTYNANNQAYYNEGATSPDPQQYFDTTGFA